ncbi:MAG: hypothetical protein M5U26_16880 [Planctomycetota bacterium]|nr:hypothetical protein [Planctomycetota bacterium]
MATGNRQLTTGVRDESGGAMPASAVVKLPTGADFRAAVYGVSFAGSADPEGGARRAPGSRFAFASEVLLQSGARPSHALVELPLGAWSERAPRVAAAEGGPLAGVKLGTRAKAHVLSGKRAYTLLVGSVAAIQHDLGADAATLTVLDDRWLLEGVPVAGQFIRDPARELTLYRERGPCRFNPDGRPNCLDTAAGPLFAPYPGYGRADGDAEPAPGAATAAARPWRHADIAEYLAATLASEAYAAETAAFPHFARADASRVLVPAGLGLALLGDAEHEPEDARGAGGFTAADREGAGRAPDLTLEGLDLLAALNRVVESAGAYALWCAPLEDSWRSVLRIVPARHLDGAGGTALARPAGGALGAHGGALGARAGTLEEDGTELYTRVVVAGDAAELERRLAFEPEGGGGLAAAWSAEDEEAFRAYVRDHPEHPGSAEAFLEAAWRYPRVFAAYHVDAEFDWLEGTKYAGFPRATPHPPILPRLLSEFTEEIEGQIRRVFPAATTVELADDEGEFRARTQLDGLEVDDDGTLWLPGLREAGLSDPQSGTWKGDLADAGTLEARALRVTLALRLDARLTAALGLHGSGEGAGADPNAEAGALAEGLARTYRVDAEGAYREHLRRESWPVPESVEGAEAAPDRAAEGAELRGDGARARAHAQRRLAEVARARRSGRLIFPAPALWTPGTAIEELVNAGGTGRYPVRGVVARVRHSYARQETEVELA